MSKLDELRKDLEDNKRSSERADFFKLKNGDNKIVILSNPVGYSKLYGVGIAYQGCNYTEYASRKYQCYIKDLSDGKIKIADLSYTVAKKILALADGARTKFDGFPMPYSLNLKTEDAGKTSVNTDPLADEDYNLSEEDYEELNSYDKIEDILERLKSAQKKKVETDPVLRQKIQDRIEAIELERESKRKEKEGKDLPTVQIGDESKKSNDTIEYPDEDIDPDDIPF